MKKHLAKIKQLAGNAKQLNQPHLQLLYASIFVIFIILALFITLPYRPRLVPVDSQGKAFETASIPIYTMNESPKFIIYSDTIVRESEKKQQLNKLAGQVGTIEAQVFGNQGIEANLMPIINSLGSDPSVFQIVIPNLHHLVPGKLSLKVVLSHNDKTFVLWQDFRWDATLLNFNQSAYTLGEAVKIGIGVVDNSGTPVCDASIRMTITSPENVRTLYHSKDNTIFSSHSCENREVTNRPDFGAVYIPSSEGRYKVELEASDSDQNWYRQSSFFASPKTGFKIRYFNLPSRMIAHQLYSPTLEVETDQAINGEVYYTIPKDLEVGAISHQGRLISDDPTANVISWPIQAEAGETVQYSFDFQTSNDFPAIYRSGPIRIVRTGSPNSVEVNELDRIKNSYIIHHPIDVFSDTTHEHQLF